jgi:hypothetical protein
MLIRIIVFVFCLIFTASVLYAQNKITGKHLENSLTCKLCHETDKPSSSATKAVCINCHGEIVKIPLREGFVEGRQVKFNVHDSHYGEIDCLNCHKIHSIGKLMCNECHHFEITVK